MKKMMIWRNLKKQYWYIWSGTAEVSLHWLGKHLLRVKKCRSCNRYTVWNTKKNALHNSASLKTVQEIRLFFCSGGAIFSSIPITQMNVLGLEEGTGNGKRDKDSLSARAWLKKIENLLSFLPAIFSCHHSSPCCWQLPARSSKTNLYHVSHMSCS